MRIFNPSTMPVISTTGTFTGNGTDNRAIPHGLGVIPLVIFVYSLTAATTNKGVIMGAGYQFAVGGVIGTAPVTTPNATNFYVSNIVNAAFNNNAENYRWVAIGV